MSSPEPVRPSTGSGSVEAEPPPKRLERPHPLTPLIRGWVVLVAIAYFFLRDLIPNGEPQEDFGRFGFGVLGLVIVAIVVLAAAAGFVSWYFTHFVIDDTELRIETGALFKSSKKIPFERVQSVDIIQPLAARIFGLAELRIEVGAGDSSIKLRYLGRAQADRIRNYLLTRALGQAGHLTDDQGPAAGILTDLGGSDTKLVVVQPQRLVASFVLSVEWLSSIVVILVILIATGATGNILYGLPILIPSAIGAVTLISNRLINMFNFTLAESPRGFRIVRGLTSLTSQSLPINRIQGVRVSQSILWKRFGWYRVDVNVLGVKGSDSEDNERSATSVLLPVADGQQVEMVLGRILPGIDLGAIALYPASPRVRVLRWFDHWTLRYGVGEHVVITEHGWITNVRDVAPHAKIQSVRIEQGPLQRRLDVAHVHFDLTPGPVTPIARHVPKDAARELALSELDRMRAARTLVRTAAPPARTRSPLDASGTAVLQAFGIGPDAYLGEGGEAQVYALDPQRVLRLYRGSDPGVSETTNQLRALYDVFDRRGIGLALPKILDAGWISGRWSSVDRRLPGRSLSGWLSEQNEAARRPVLLKYLEATLALRRLPSPVTGFARLVGPGAPQYFETLGDLLTAQMSDRLSHSQQRLEADVPNIADVWDDLQDELAEIDVEPTIVHGDICPPNVFVEAVTGHEPTITAIGDFSPHTLHADPMMDVVGAIAFLELETYAGAEDDAAWLTDRARERFGDQFDARMRTYRRFYGFYFSDTYAFEPSTYAWCLRQLR